VYLRNAHLYPLQDFKALYKYCIIIIIIIQSRSRSPWVTGPLATSHNVRVLVATPTIRAAGEQPDDIRVQSNIDAMHGDARQKHQTICRRSKDSTSASWTSDNSAIVYQQQPPTVMAAIAPAACQPACKVKVIVSAVCGFSHYWSAVRLRWHVLSPYTILCRRAMNINFM